MPVNKGEKRKSDFESNSTLVPSRLFSLRGETFVLDGGVHGWARHSWTLPLLWILKAAPVRPDASAKYSDGAKFYILRVAIGQSRGW